MATFFDARHTTIAVSMIIGFLASTRAVEAATFDIAEGNAVSLIAAIHAANDETAFPGPDNIDLASGSTYTLSATALPSITSEVIVNGNGATIERSADVGTPEFRIFHVATGAELTLDDVIVANGRVGSGQGGGGGVAVEGGATANINSTTISTNHSHFFGGGIWADSGAVVLITRSIITGNSSGSQGGGVGIGDNAVVGITHSTISTNTAPHGGGGIVNYSNENFVIVDSNIVGNVAGNEDGNGGGGISSYSSGVVHVVGSTISNNVTEGGGNGGGIAMEDGHLVVTNDTISGNTADDSGGGIWLNSKSRLKASNVTIFGNSGRSGLAINRGFAELKNTVIGASQLGPNCAGVLGNIVASGTNVDTDGTCAAFDPDFITTTPEALNLGPLQDNGGPTPTHALLPGSVAIDVVFDCTTIDGEPLTTDQRGVEVISRPTGPACDIGAYERKSDFDPPVITTPGDITHEATDPSGVAVNFVVTAVDDVDGPVSTQCVPPSNSVFPLGQTVVTCTANDLSANVSTAEFTVTVLDTTSPAITTPGDMSVEAAGSTGAVVNYTATAADLIDGVVIPDCTPLSGTAFAIGDTMVTCTAIDSEGNVSVADFTITVQDTTAPTINVPADIIVEATGPSGAPASYFATASDLVDGTISPDCSPATGSIFPLGETPVVCTVTDTNDNTAAAAFAINVRDTTPPVVSPLSDIVAEATGSAGASVSYSATADDLVDGAVVPDCNPVSGATFVLGETTVDCAATDSSGNVSTEAFTVTVRDTTPPTIAIPADITSEATQPAGASVNYTVTADDVFDGGVIPVCNPISGQTFPLGETTVNCTATDSSGNSSGGAFLVTVQDTVGPTLAPARVDSPQDGFLPFESQSGFPASVGSGPVTIDMNATDAAGVAAVQIVVSPGGDVHQATEGPIYWTATNIPLTPGVNSITATATDVAGHTAQTSFDIALDLDLDGDGIHNNVDKIPNYPSTDFSDRFGAVLGSSPFGVAITPDGNFAYVASHNSSVVSVIDTASYEVVATVPVGASPYGVAITPDGSRVYVANYGSNSLTVIDAATNSGVDTITGVNQPTDIAVDPFGQYAYVTSYGSHTVAVVDVATNTVTGSSIPVGSGPWGVTVTPDGDRVYVANYASNSVTQIDTSTHSVTDTIPGMSRPIDIAADPIGHYIYVSNEGSSSVAVIDTATNAVHGPRIATGDSPYAVAVTPDGARAYVANAGSHNVTVIDTATRQALSSIPIENGPWGIAVTPDSGFAYVTSNHPAGPVSVIHTPSNTVIHEIENPNSGTTFGTIGEGTDVSSLTVQDEPNPDGVRITYEGPPAEFTPCGGGGFSLKLVSGGLIVTCSSVKVQVLTGEVEMAYTGTDGTVASAVIPAGNTLKADILEPLVPLAFAAPASNVDPVVVTIDDVRHTVAPGEELVDPRASLASFVVLGHEGVWFKRGSRILSGNVGADSVSKGPFLNGGAEVSLGKRVRFVNPGSQVFGDTVRTRPGVRLFDVNYNRIIGPGRVLGERVTPIALPLVSEFPAVPVDFTPDWNRPVDIPYAGDLTLEPGNYGRLIVRPNATVVFAGGVYNFARWDIRENANVHFAAPSEIRIAGKLEVDQGSYVGPEPLAAGTEADDIVIYVKGRNGRNGKIGASPKAAMFGVKTELIANVYVPNGTLWLRRDSKATGALLGRWVVIGERAEAKLQSAFAGG